MAKNKKVDPDEGVHSCEKCKDFDRYVRQQHEMRLQGAARVNSDVVNKMVERFEREMPFIDKRVKEDRAKGYIRN